MSDPLVDPTELGVYLNDPDIDTARAADLIDDAQTLCESVVFPLPDTAAVIVKRVAGAAYVSITSPRQAQLNAAGGLTTGGGGGVWLTRFDREDLRRLAGGTSGAFTISMLPATYAPVLPIWDVNGESGVATS